ncbi:MAG: DUF1622 domain-containing protein [Xenococcus sp. MO_188.B8]|nr:DUF1622 domain-containing protein [Xenococcus sp. MO_188.B8]
MEWIEQIETNLILLVELLQLCLEVSSALCVFFGFLTTLRMAILLISRFQEYRFVLIRLRFGSWLALALEYQLGADILGTTIAPSFEALGQLAVLAVIRTFLNYFLTKELEAEAKLQASILNNNNK